MIEGGLGIDQAIEGIIVMRRQAAGVLGLGIRHRHDLEAEHQHRSDDRSIEAKLPDRSLDRDFPNRRRADDNLARLITHRRAQPRHDPAGPLTAHRRICVSIGSARALLEIFLYFGRQGAGTSLAFGLPALAMTISSLARSTSVERFVFAS